MVSIIRNHTPYDSILKDQSNLVNSPFKNTEFVLNNSLQGSSLIKPLLFALE